MPPSGGTPSDINVIYTPLESTLMGYNYVAGITAFIRLAVVASQIRESKRNSDKI